MGTNNKIEIGKFGQQLAVQFLLQRGYEIITENYYCREGEIDIVAKKDEQIVFVEVKTRTNRNFGLPEEALTEIKKEKITKTIFDYLESNEINTDNWRIDYIAVELDKFDKNAKIRHYKAVD